MTTLRRGAAATLLLLTPVLAACGDDSDEPTGASSSESPSTDVHVLDEEQIEDVSPSTEPETEESEGDGSTVALSELTLQQQALYEEVLLFVPVAEADRADSEGGMGFETGSFKDADDGSETGMVRPDGIKVATGYEMTHNPDGFEFTLYADGASLSWADEAVLIDVPVTEVEDDALVTDADALIEAIGEWVEANGTSPSVGSGFDVYELTTAIWDEGEEREVEVPKSDGITMSYGSTPETYSIGLTSDSTGESAVIENGTLSYLASRTVVED